MKKVIIGLGCIILATVVYILAIDGSKGKANEASIRDGEKLYTQMCSGCHGATGLGEASLNGTALNNEQFLSSISDQDLFNYIKYGRVEALMPEYGSVLKDEDIRKLTAFVRSWQKEEIEFKAPDSVSGNEENGKRLYGLYCLSCHGEAGQGKKSMGTSLTNHEYLKYTTDEQIWIATAYGREQTRMGPSLKGLDGVRQLKEQEISDIIAYIRGLQPE